MRRRIRERLRIGRLALVTTGALMDDPAERADLLEVAYQALSRARAASRTVTTAHGPTVADIWEAYSKVGPSEMRSWKSELGRAKHILRILGERRAADLTLEDIDRYREIRRNEMTWRHRPTTAATRNREVARVRRMLEWAVDRRKLMENPLAKVGMEAEDNVRRTVIGETELERLLSRASALLGAIVLTAIDSGMRRGEIIKLQRGQVDLETGVVQLAPQDTKTRSGRSPRLTKRAIDAIGSLPRRLESPWLFPSPRTGRALNPRTVSRWYEKAVHDAGLSDVWIHDLRRSFVTSARKRGVPESVIMKMTGHRTRDVFMRYNVIDDDDIEQATRRIEDGIALERALAAQRRGPKKSDAAATKVLDGKNGQE